MGYKNQVETDAKWIGFGFCLHALFTEPFSRLNVNTATKHWFVNLIRTYSDQDLLCLICFSILPKEERRKKKRNESFLLFNKSCPFGYLHWLEFKVVNFLQDARKNLFLKRTQEAKWHNLFRGEKWLQYPLNPCWLWAVILPPTIQLQ